MLIPRPLAVAVLALCFALPGLAQNDAAPTAPRGSIVEDRAARKLIDAGDLRFEAGESDKAVEIWGSVLERYPRSRMRFAAHLKLGGFYLDEQRAFERARGHFEAAADEANPDPDERALALLKSGVCDFEARHYGRCFKTMRAVIEDFPTSGHVNEAYYYIGLGHFKLGHYSRAIESLEKVGTALADDDLRVEKVEAGRRLYVKIDDRDLATLGAGEGVTVTCKAASGDTEQLRCDPVGREVRVALGSLPTALGAPSPDNGRLEVRGGDTVEVLYTDAHTAEMEFDVRRLREVSVIGNGFAQITDGSYRDDLGGVVIGKEAHLQVTDPDGDRGDGADRLRARVEILRAKTAEQIEDEKAALVAAAAADPLAETPEGPEVDRYALRDALDVVLTEAAIGGAAEGAPVHSGVFRAAIPLGLAAAPNLGDDLLGAEPGDLLRLTYIDAVNLSGEPAERRAEAKTVEGNLGDVRVTEADISDQELRLRTQLKTAGALTQIGNHYKDFGIREKADVKYTEALDVCEDITEAAERLGGKVLEETYVQLWRIYFAMEKLDLALAMSSRLQREFPNSEFVDEAILQQAHVARERGDLARAITLYSSLVRLKESPMRGEGQFGVAECYEQMATEARDASAEQLYERAFLAYEKVYEQFPESGRVGEAVAKMANFYYQKRDYARAVDVFENVLADHPDANFLDVILFNYGRCLYRLDRRPQAAAMFDRLIDDFPESPLAGEAKQISSALAKAVGAAAPQ